MNWLLIIEGKCLWVGHHRRGFLLAAALLAGGVVADNARWNRIALPADEVIAVPASAPIASRRAMDGDCLRKDGELCRESEHCAFAEPAATRGSAPAVGPVRIASEPVIGSPRSERSQVAPGQGAQSLARQSRSQVRKEVESEQGRNAQRNDRRGKGHCSRFAVATCPCRDPVEGSSGGAREVVVRAYCPCWRVTFYCRGRCCTDFDGITASGKRVQAGMCAADKRIPFGTRLRIEGLGEFVVEDRGRKIYGNRIDIYVPGPPWEAHRKARRLGVLWRRIKLCE
jgi:3D (Asp-Asp-Asp) domain-containing protein